MYYAQLQQDKDDLERKVRLIESDLDKAEEKLADLQSQNKSLETQVDESER